MEEYLGWLVAGVIGYLVGAYVKEKTVISSMIANAPDVVPKLLAAHEIMRNIHSETEIETDITDAVEVRSEQVGDAVYTYDKITGEFLSQAADLHQSMLLAAKRFPHKRFWHAELREDSQSS